MRKRMSEYHEPATGGALADVLRRINGAGILLTVVYPDGSYVGYWQTAPVSGYLPDGTELPRALREQESDTYRVYNSEVLLLTADTASEVEGFLRGFYVALFHQTGEPEIEAILTAVNRAGVVWEPEILEAIQRVRTSDELFAVSLCYRELEQLLEPWLRFRRYTTD